MPPVRQVLSAAVLAAGVMLSIAPAAHANPVPDPEPVPTPGLGGDGGGAGCQGGEVMQDGNCVPAMTAVGSTAGGDDDPADVPLRYNETESSTTYSGVGADLVPNINGTPCTGYWMSMACAASAEADVPGVRPHSTLSTSP